MTGEIQIPLRNSRIAIFAFIEGLVIDLLPFSGENMTTNDHQTFFAPELFINNRVKDISFYEKAFGAKDYEYGYPQATIKDPFGHYWQIQKKIL